MPLFITFVKYYFQSCEVPKHLLRQVTVILLVSRIIQNHKHVRFCVLWLKSYHH